MKQRQALDILKIGHNVFLTGSAGSGKTHVLNQYIRYLKRKKLKVGVTASTGIAATHLGGVTIHSWSGIGISDSLSQRDIKELLKKNYLKKHFSSDVLIVDEVSMLHAHQLDMINQLAKTFRKSTEPFGGMQVVLCGDFFQLPPVSRDSQSSAMVTESDIWQEMNHKVCYLSEQHRQEDNDFLNILNEIRSGFVSDESRELLAGRISQQLDQDIEPTKLYTHNIDVDKINHDELQKIKGATKLYKMKASGKQPLTDILKKGCLAPENLLLKIGSRVMFVKNNFEQGYVNGTLGHVVNFSKDKMPVVETKRGQLITARPAEWVIEEDGIKKAEIRQIPLRLAWAITIHKSQGLSLDSAEIDLSKSFVTGMGYVALSRVRTLDGLVLKGINQLALEIDQKVLELDNQLQASSEHARQRLSKMSADEKTKAKKIFAKDFSKSRKPKASGKKTGRLKTKEMLLKKRSIREMASEQAYLPTTIIGHIERLLATETNIDISYLLPGDRDYKKIRKAFEYCGWEYLRPVYEHLNEKYNYDTLHLVRAWYMRKK